MADNLTPEQFQELKNELTQVKKDLELAKKAQNQVPSNPMDKIVDTLLEHGPSMFAQYLQMQKDAMQKEMDNNFEREREEIKIIDKLDSREKIYKGILISVCIISLLLSALFIQKAEVVIPVISLIIGLLFKSNSLSEFFTHRKDEAKDMEQ